jgi:hypothetical protein
MNSYLIENQVNLEREACGFFFIFHGQTNAETRTLSSATQHACRAGRAKA